MPGRGGAGGAARAGGSAVPSGHGGPVPKWVASEADLAELIATLESLDEFCFDTEFHRERTYYPQLALLQVGWTGGIALVDQPWRSDIAPLGACFVNAATVVAHAAGQDLEVLGRACGCVPTNLFDTQVAAGFPGLLDAVALHPR